MDLPLGSLQSILVKQDPRRECEDDHERRVDEWGGTDVRFQIASLNDPMRDER